MLTFNDSLPKLNTSVWYTYNRTESADLYQLAGALKIQLKRKPALAMCIKY